MGNLEVNCFSELNPSFSKQTRSLEENTISGIIER